MTNLTRLHGRCVLLTFAVLLPTIAALKDDQHQHEELRTTLATNSLLWAFYRILLSHVLRLVLVLLKLFLAIPEPTIVHSLPEKETVFQPRLHHTFATLDLHKQSVGFTDLDLFESSQQPWNLAGARILKSRAAPHSIAFLFLEESDINSRYRMSSDLDYSRRNKVPRQLTESEKARLEEFIDSIHYSARLLPIA